VAGQLGSQSIGGGFIGQEESHGRSFAGTG
jgi:hypothetical protein